MKVRSEKRQKVDRAFNIVFIVLAVLVLAVVGGLAYLTVNEYLPAGIEMLADYDSGETTGEAVVAGQSMSIMSWNIGYAGLGEEADFFMDGGKNVTSYDEEGVQANLDGIISEIQSLDTDIVMLQEADLNSKRTYGINEVEQIADGLDGYQYSYAKNFDAVYVPYPIPTMGKVQSGIVVYSKLKSYDAQRIALPCPFSWPIRIANLKRCLLVTRIPVEGSDKELVIINLHLEAYDSGEGKIAQTAVFRSIFEGELEKGNYVIAGGDFNQTFSDIDLDLSAAPLISDDYWQPGIIDVDDFTRNEQFFMDSDTPSCRSLDQKLVGADTENFQYYIIDGFIVSSNIQVDDFETLDLGFEYSDHNPVVMNFTLLPEN